ncbi:MAG: hypothetical protein ACRCT1_14655 [Microcoleaceae cyanobacterium]
MGLRNLVSDEIDYYVKVYGRNPVSQRSCLVVIRNRVSVGTPQCRVPTMSQKPGFGGARSCFSSYSGETG